MKRGEVVMIVKGEHSGELARVNDIFEDCYYVRLLDAPVQFEIRIPITSTVRAVGRK